MTYEIGQIMVKGAFGAYELKRKHWQTIAGTEEEYFDFKPLLEGKPKYSVPRRRVDVEWRPVVSVEVIEEGLEIIAGKQKVGKQMYARKMQAWRDVLKQNDFLACCEIARDTNQFRTEVPYNEHLLNQEVLALLASEIAVVTKKTLADEISNLESILRKTAVRKAKAVNNYE